MSTWDEAQPDSMAPQEVHRRRTQGSMVVVMLLLQSCYGSNPSFPIQMGLQSFILTEGAQIASTAYSSVLIAVKSAVSAVRPPQPSCEGVTAAAVPASTDDLLLRKIIRLVAAVSVARFCRRRYGGVGEIVSAMRAEKSVMSARTSSRPGRME